MKGLKKHRWFVSPLGITAFYAIFGGVWILSSDRLVSALFSDPQTLSTAQTVKGWFFVLVTSALLFGLTRVLVRSHRRDERRLEAILNHTPAAVALMDTSGRYVMVNEAFERLHGTQAGIVAGKTAGEVFGPTHGGADRDTLRQILETGEPSHFEETLVGSDGTERTVMTIAFPIPDDRGGWIAVGRISVDISERMAAEAALKRREALLATVLEATHEGIAVLDRDLTVIRHNAVMEKRFERSILERNCWNASYSSGGTSQNGLARAALETGKPQREVCRESDKNGAPVWLEILFYPMFGPDGSVQGVVEYFRDVTIEREAIARIEHRERLLSLITDNIPANIGYIDATMRFRHVNRRYEAVFGIPVADIVGRPVCDVVGESIFAIIEPFAKQALEGRTVSFRRAFNYDRLGLRWVDVAYVPDIDDHGQVTGFHVLGLDVTEAQEATENLRKARATLQAAIEQMPAGVLVVDAVSHDISLANSAVLAIHGIEDPDGRLEPTAIQQIIVSELFHPDGRPIGPEDLPATRALRDGVTIRGQEIMIRNRRGETRHVLANAGPVRAEDGTIVGAVAVLPDITERKRAEDDLRFRADFERRIAAISTRFINSGDTGLPDLFVWALEEVGALFGFDRGSIAVWTEGGNEFEEFIEWISDGTPSVKDMADDIAPGIFWLHDQNVDGFVNLTSAGAGSPWRPEIDRIFKRLDMESIVGVPIARPGRFNAYVGFSSRAPGREWSEEAVYLLRIFADLVGNALEHRDAQTALRTSEARFRAFMDQAGDLFILVGGDGQIHEVNRMACAMLGYSREELIGANVSMFDPKDGPRAPELWEILEREHSVVLETTVHRKDGSVFPIDIRFGIAEIGGRKRALAWGRDMTEKRRNEEEARRLQNELTHAQRLGTMGEMATGFAHELNQPLAAIGNYAIGSLRRLERGTVDPKTLTPIMERIAGEAQRAGEIIRRVRSFVSKRPPEMTEIDFVDVVQTCVTLLTNEARHAQVAISSDLAPNLPKVLGDEISIQQVLINLMRNGIEAIVDGADPSRSRTVEIGAETNGRQVRVSVSDSGPGMPPDVRAHLFEPFFTTKQTGTGMGLSICRTIIEALGGRIEVESKAGCGSKVTFTLPIGGVPVRALDPDQE